MSIETTICPRCESTCVVHLPETIGFNQWICNQWSHQWDFASPEERACVPKHLTGGRIEQFLEEFLAIKVVIILLLGFCDMCLATCVGYSLQESICARGS